MRCKELKTVVVHHALEACSSFCSYDGPIARFRHWTSLALVTKRVVGNVDAKSNRKPQACQWFTVRNSCMSKLMSYYSRAWLPERFLVEARLPLRGGSLRRCSEKCSFEGLRLVQIQEDFVTCWPNQRNEDQQEEKYEEEFALCRSSTDLRRKGPCSYSLTNQVDVPELFELGCFDYLWISSVSFEFCTSYSRHFFFLTVKVCKFLLSSSGSSMRYNLSYR